MTRKELKALVKECLAEILVEGLGDRGALVERTHPQTQFSAIADAAQRRQRVARGTKVKMAPTAALNEAVEEVAAGNAVLKNILADTAQTTMQQQQSGPVGAVESFVAAHAPEEVFGSENAGKWAQLAFMDGVAKKSS